MRAPAGLAPLRSRRAGRRIGLALAGGGPGGAVYEIGALRAFEEALDGIDFNDLDCYVGVSAGSFVAACLANGLTPSQLVRGIATDEGEDQPFVPEAFFIPAYGEIARRALMVPRLIVESFWKLATSPGDQRPFDVLLRLSRALPVGLFDNEPIREYLQRLLSRRGRTDDFRQLRRRLIVVAADLEAGTAIRFGTRGEDHVPISRAVQASTAVPGLYPPVMIDGRTCVDGVLLKTVHASAALEEGVDLLLCINPIVPVDAARAALTGALPPGVLSARGLPAVLSQTLRTIVHSRMRVGMAQYRTKFPHADVVLFEPHRDEHGMFFANIFSFAERRAVCDLAYRATRADLRRRRARLEPLLARHGIRMRHEVLDDPSRDVWQSVGLAAAEPMTALATRLTSALDRLERIERSPRRPVSGRRPWAAAGAPRGAR